MGLFPAREAPKRFLKVREAAAILRCSPESARLLLVAAGVPRIMPPGPRPRPRYSRPEVLDLAAKLSKACEECVSP